MTFTQSFMDELMARSDIVDVVSGYVTLTRHGSNLFGLCPFHSEKTPSFSVAPDKQMYHCFGCKKGGDVINFIMDIEGLPFPRRSASWPSVPISPCRRRTRALPPRRGSAAACWS